MDEVMRQVLADSIMVDIADKQKEINKQQAVLDELNAQLDSLKNSLDKLMVE